LTQKRTAGACVVAKGGTGRLIGSTENLTIAEKGFINEMVAGGRTVEIIPTGASRTADFLIDGVRHELKTLSGVVNQTSDGLSSALSNRIMNGRGQSGNIIVDARTQPGMTAEIAERGIIRAFGKDNITGAKIQNITVITPEGTVSIPRKP
jgi:filamentous hemagglutinin